MWNNKDDSIDRKTNWQRESAADGEKERDEMILKLSHKWLHNLFAFFLFFFFDFSARLWKTTLMLEILRKISSHGVSFFSFLFLMRCAAAFHISVTSIDEKYLFRMHIWFGACVVCALANIFGLNPLKYDLFMHYFNRNSKRFRHFILIYTAFVAVLLASFKSILRFFFSFLFLHFNFLCNEQLKFTLRNFESIAQNYWTIESSNVSNVKQLCFFVGFDVVAFQSQH